MLAELLLAAWAHICEIGQVLKHMQFGVLVQVPLWGAVWVAVVDGVVRAGWARSGGWRSFAR